MQVIGVLSMISAAVRGLQQTRLFVQQVRQSDTVQNSLADFRMKARGHVAPVIIERLDDGTDPTQQHISFDYAPRFSPERIAHALKYWDSQSFENIMRSIGAFAIAQASADAAPGDERSTTLVLDSFDGAVAATYRLWGKVDGEWEAEFRSRHVDWGRIHAAVWSRARMQSQLRDEERARNKAERKRKKSPNK